jgi:hypothetical protein
MATWTIENEDGPNDPTDAVGGCEHGDHPNRDPAGNRRVCEENRRFCSPECAACEGEEFDTTTHCCAGLCGFPSELHPAPPVAP